MENKYSLKLINLQNFALYFFCITLHFEFWDPLHTNIDFFFSKVSIVFYLLTAMVSFRRFFAFVRARDVLYPIVLVFCAQSVVSYIYRNELFSTFFDFPFFLNLVLFFLLVNHSRVDLKSLERGLLAFAFGGILFSLFYALGLNVDVNADAILEGRVSLFGDNQNAIGVRISMTLFILITYLLKKDITKWSLVRFASLVFLPILLSLLSATGSRVAILSFFLGVVITFILRKPRALHNPLLKYLVGVVLTCSVALYFISNDIFSTRLADAVISGDTSGRDFIWSVLFDLVLKNPFFGQGTTGYAYNSYLTFNGIASPHNVIVETLCYTGVFGTVLFLLFIYRLSRRAYKSATNADVLPLLLLIPIFGVIMSGQMYYPKFIWVAFAYIVSRSLPPKTSSTIKTGSVTIPPIHSEIVSA